MRAVAAGRPELHRPSLEVPCLCDRFAPVPGPPAEHARRQGQEEIVDLVGGEKLGEEAGTAFANDAAMAVGVEGRHDLAGLEPARGRPATMWRGGSRPLSTAPSASAGCAGSRLPEPETTYRRWRGERP